jgi:photosystem II stability/assembly factor-like uncharacterized protein
MKRILFSISVIILFLSAKSFSQNWTYVSNTGTTFILYGMSFPPGQSTIGFACGMQYTYDADGVIVKTVDGGDNWTQIWPASGTIDGLQGIWFTSDLVGFACGWNNYFIKTTDGGTTWTPITVGADVWYYRDVEFWDASNGIAVAVMNTTGSQAAFITSNGGTTWAPSTSGMGVADVMGISYASQNIVYGVGQSASVYKSTDGGHNWTVSSTLSAMLLGVDFVSTNFGVVGGEENIFATNNGGSSWTTYNTGYENFYGTLALADGTGYCAGSDENIYKTTNNGQTWTMDFNGSGSSTIYRIRATANGTLFACGSQGKIMKLTPPLDADFTATPTTVCTGGTVNFYDNSTGAITAWAWAFEGGTPPTSTQENPVVTYNTPGSYDVQLVVTAGSYNSTELKTNYITVYGALVAPAAPTGPAEVCGSYSYQYTTQGVMYAESYQWEVNPTSAGTMTGNDIVGTFMASNTWSGTYTIKVRAENNCGNGPWSPDFTGTLYHNPVVYDLLGDGVYCEGEPGSEITLSGSETGVSYELFKDNMTTGLLVSDTGNPISFGFFEETGLYTATGFTDHCDENMVGQVYVHMQPIPGQAGTPEGPESACNDETSEYSTSGASNADGYNWALTPEGAGIITSNGDECSVEWNDGFSGTAYLTVVGENACGSGVPSEELGITVNAAPDPSVTGPGFVCDNEQDDYSTAENSGSNYTWEVLGGDIISGAGTWQITVLWGVPGTGSVKVTETTSAGCQANSVAMPVTIDDCTGVGENTSDEICIYPNPFACNLHFSGLKDATIRIYNPLGEEVLYFEHADDQKIINTSTLIKSIYLVKVEQAGKLSVTRLVKP